MAGYSTEAMGQAQPAIPNNPSGYTRLSHARAPANAYNVPHESRYRPCPVGLRAGGQCGRWLCHRQTAPAGLQAPASPARAAVIALSGPVDEQMRRSLDRHLRDARATGTTTIILSIDTYGGLVTSGLEISALLKRQTALHTIAFIDEKALSAGAMIALACDEIVMAPTPNSATAPDHVRTGDGAARPPARHRALQAGKPHPGRLRRKAPAATATTSRWPCRW